MYSGVPITMPTSVTPEPALREPRDAEVHHLQCVRRAPPPVLRLDVAMITPLLVRDLERATQLLAIGSMHRHRLAPRE
jgi:hypothetical protein